MRTIPAERIKNAVADLCVRANLKLRPDVVSALRRQAAKETNARAKRILKAVLYNASLAAARRLAICQDTGMPVVFLKIGQEVRIAGDLRAAVNRGVAEGYRRASLRNSIIADPLARGRPGYQPAVLHTDIVRGKGLQITVLPKGFGCENKSQLSMFKPTAGWEEIEQFIVGAVQKAGPDACPPYVVGVGIGGTADYACLLAKKALLKPLQQTSRLESGLLQAINKLNIGPMGLGGKTTALAVRLETYPTHIAGLPVAVNISCHALRSATKNL